MPRKTVTIPPVDRRIVTEQVMDRLKCSRRQVYRLAAMGLLTVYKSGPGRNLYDAAEVEALIAPADRSLPKYQTPKRAS